MQVSFVSFQKFSAREQSLERIARKLSRNNSRIASRWRAFLVSVEPALESKSCPVRTWHIPLPLKRKLPWKNARRGQIYRSEVSLWLYGIESSGCWELLPAAQSKLCFFATFHLCDVLSAAKSKKQMGEWKKRI